MKQLIGFITLILVVNGAFASTYKGQMAFSKSCVSCHTNAQDFIESKTKLQWKTTIEENGIGLAKIHLKSNRAKDSWKYFYSDEYKKSVKNIEEFLVEYAKDSGKVPICK